MLTIKSGNAFDGIYDVIITNIFILDGFVYVKITEFPLEKLNKVYQDFLWCSNKLIYFYFYENSLSLFKIEVKLVDMIVIQKEERTVYIRIRII